MSAREIRKLGGKTTSGTRISSSETIYALVTKKKGWVIPLETNTFQGCMSSSTLYVLQSNLVQKYEKYEKILDAADFPSRENCSFIRLNDALRKTLLNAAK